MKKYIKGFTLIELLVVIAIIGILAAVILVSLQSARGKASDVKVISSVKQMKIIFEANYDGASYPDLTNTSPIYGGLADSGNPGTTTLNLLLADIIAQGGGVNVVNEPGVAVTDYAIYGQLVSTSTAYFCVDSKGNSNQNASANTTVQCPL